MFDLMPFDRGRNSLFHYFDELEKNFFNNTGSNTGLNGFKTDILDKDDRYILQAELPGFNKEDISIDLSGDRLTIRAAHKEESEEKDAKGNFIHRERHYGAYARSFDVAGINTEQIAADYKDGILQLDLPKAVPAAPQTRQIEVR